MPLQQAPIPCTIALNDPSPHARQIVAGFVLLQRRGRISLSTSRAAPSGPPLGGYQVVEAVVDGAKVLYDVRDGYNFPPDDSYDGDAFHRALEAVDFCFRRSYDAARHDGRPQGPKVQPLGLNYLVSVPGMWPRYLARPCGVRRPVRIVLGREPSLRSLERPPAAATSGAILFMSRAWDPAAADVQPQLRAERERLNESRAACIRAGRRVFPGRFVGGFAPSAFAAAHYGDCLLPSPLSSEKRVYLRRMRRADVCVATTGLHGSISWKLGEYVACSKAIVSEPLGYALPGGFAAGVNYLPFSGIDEFVEAVGRLAASREQRAAMQRANWDYYREWVRPDALVWHSILRVLRSTRGPDYSTSAARPKVAPSALSSRQGIT